MRLDSAAPNATSLYAEGRLAEAEAAYREALDADPASAEAAAGLVQIALDVHRAQDALALCEACLRLHPRRAQFHLLRAQALLALEKWAEGLAAARRAAALAPQAAAGARTLEGMAQRGLGRLDEAEECYRRALEARPDAPEILNNLAELALERGRLAEADELLARAQSLRAGMAPALANLGRLRGEQGRLDEAETAWRRAVDTDPHYAKAWSGLGSALHDLGQGEPALKAYRRAVALAPDDEDMQFNLAVELLQGEDFVEGWPLWQRRFRSRQVRPSLRPFAQPAWDGGALAGRSLVLWGEQGPGDTILFASAIPDLSKRGARLVIEAQSRLAPLFARSFPEALVVERSDPPHPEALACDLQCAMGSLAPILRPDAASFPDRGGYLKADPDLVRRLRARYAADGRRLVGLSWGSAAPGIASDKSLSAKALATILDVPDCRFVSLQYGTTEIPAPVLADAEIDQLKDMDSFAAQVAAMDLVVSVSATAVHVAGGLGVPVWTMLPFAKGCHWYWFRGRESGLWYPRQRLFRQERQGDWTPVADRVARELAGA